MEQARTQTRIEDLPLFAAAKPRPVPAPEPTNPRRTGVEWTEAMEKIWAVLQTCVGAENGKTASRIAEAAGLWPEKSWTDRGRAVRKQLEAFLDELPLPVVASPNREIGFFVVSCAAEMEMFEQLMHSRNLGNFRKIAATRRLAKLVGLVHVGKRKWADPVGGVRLEVQGKREQGHVEL